LPPESKISFRKIHISEGARVAKPVGLRVFKLIHEKSAVGTVKSKPAVLRVWDLMSD